MKISLPHPYVTYGITESGDDIGVIIWRHPPTVDEVDAAYREIWPEEYEEVGFVNWKLETAIHRD